VGWDEVGDLSQYDTKASFFGAFASAFQEGLYRGNAAKTTEKAGEVWTLTELVPGDVVVANQGTSHVVGIGVVNDRGYEWRDDLPEFAHTVGIDWKPDSARDIDPIRRWAFKTVAPISQPEYGRILKGRSTAAPQPQMAAPTVTPVDPLLLEISEQLRRKGQVILYGPPGTGKTYNARRFAVWWLADRTGHEAAASLLADDAAFRLIEEALVKSETAGRVWWVSAKATEWSWEQLFVDGTVEYRHARLQKNYPLLTVGDLVVGYQANPTKRIVALGRIARTLHPTEQGSKITIEPIRKVSNGPTWDELAKDEHLAGSEPIRNRAQGTLFALTPSEASYLLSWLVERDPQLADVVESDDGSSVGHLTRVTFHPSYTYEDFVEGFKPQSTGTSSLQLALEDGVFKRVCATARAKPDEPFLLLIDEINRGNIPKIFGELITLLEQDKRGMTVTLPLSRERFDVPRNVYLLGTMNTADRSIRLLDAALRRRFAFIELMPEVGLLEGELVGGFDLGLFLRLLNDRIVRTEGREKQIGHSFLLDGGEPIDDPEMFLAQFRYDIVPLLQEYAFEDYGRLESYLGKAVVDADGQRIKPGVLEDAQVLIEALAAHFQEATAKGDTLE
jgi:5-methylcytosine-specific restriction protein B